MALGVKVRSARKIGFFSALTMLLGSVVGIGIFFKNHGVLRTNDWDGIGVVVAWVLGGLVCLCAALVFSEMGAMKTSKVHGLSGWAMKVNGKAFGYFHRFNYSFFYYGLLAASLGVFASEAVTNIFVAPLLAEQPPAWMHIVVGLTMAFLIVTLNYYSVHASGIVQQVTTVLKFIPLVVVALAGVILFTTNNAPANLADSALFGHNAFTNGRGFNFSYMLASLPGVLFAYDAFLGVGSLSNKMIGGEKKVPYIVVIGMLTVIALYTMVGIASAAHGSGFITGQVFGKAPSDGLGLFDQILPAAAAKGFGIFVTVFVAVSSVGVLNGISASFVATIEQALDTETLFKSHAIRRRFKSYGPLVVCMAVLFFWTVMLGVPVIAMQSDAIVDGLSNFPTLFSFAMYVPILIGYGVQRKKLGLNSFKTWFVWTAIVIAVVGIMAGVGYQLFYSYLVRGWIEYAQGDNQSTHWGLFVGDSGAFYGVSRSMAYWESFFVLISTVAAFLIAPYINYWLIKKYENRDPYEIKGAAETFEEETRYQENISRVGLLSVAAAGVPEVMVAPVKETSDPAPTKKVVTQAAPKSDAKKLSGTKKVSGTKKQ